MIGLDNTTYRLRGLTYGDDVCQKYDPVCKLGRTTPVMTKGTLFTMSTHKHHWDNKDLPSIAVPKKTRSIGCQKRWLMLTLQVRKEVAIRKILGLEPMGAE
jgi:hypothetical protein